MPMPKSQRSAPPIPPPPSTLPHSGTGAKGLGKDLILSSLSVLLLRGPASPSLTLASAPLAREHRGPPVPARHWLPCWVRCTGAPDDTAAQGWGLGPQLGARRRSPNTCRPVLDTVYASFCREYLNTCNETQDLPLGGGTHSLSAALLCPPVPHPLPCPPVSLGEANKRAACPGVRTAGAFPDVLKAAWWQSD